MSEQPEGVQVPGGQAQTNQGQQAQAPAQQQQRPEAPVVQPGYNPTLAALAGSLDPAEFKKLQDSLGAVKGPETGTPTGVDNVNQAAPVAPEAKAPESDPAKQGAPDDSGDNKPKEPGVLEKFGLVKDQVKQQSSIPEALKSDEVKEYLKSKFGVDNPDTFFEKVSPEWRKASQEAADYKKKLDATDNLFKELPEELFGAVEAFAKGGDWKSVIKSRPDLDFSKESKDHQSKQLVDTYLPNQFTQEEWDDYSSTEPTPGTKKAIDLAIAQAQMKYESDKVKFKNARAVEVDRAQKAIALKQESINSSVAHLKSSLPDMPESILKEVESDLVSGNYRNFLYNQDGTYTKEAAYRILYAKHGPELMEALRDRAVTDAVSKEREQRISVLPDTPAGGSGAGSSQSRLGKNAQEYVSTVIPQTKKRHY